MLLSQPSHYREICGRILLTEPNVKSVAVLIQRSQSHWGAQWGSDKGALDSEEVIRCKAACGLAGDVRVSCRIIQDLNPT